MSGSPDTHVRSRAQDMKKRGHYGHIINISSMSGHRVPPGGGAFYAATKHALRALTEGLRQEVRLQGRVSGLRDCRQSLAFVSWTRGGGDVKCLGWRSAVSGWHACTARSHQGPA